MIGNAVMLALGQMGDPRFRRVVFRGILLALGLLLGAYVLMLGLVFGLGPGLVLSLPLVDPALGPVLIALGIGVVWIVLSAFLMVPLAALFCGLYLEEVVQAVEDRHYPRQSPPQPARLADTLIGAVNFLGLFIAVNLVALVLGLFLPPALPFAFWVANGFLLGREFFMLVAMRRLARTEARRLQGQNGWTILLAGMLTAAPLTIPVLNLIVPVVAVAVFTHLFEAMSRRAI